MNKDASDPDLDKEILLRKAGEFDGNLQATQADISQTGKRIGELNDLLAKTPDRLTTQVTSGDNPQLLAFLKSNLADLENKRTDLLSKYQPTYRLVQEVDKQIADLQRSIAAESAKPVQQQSTGENPTYELLKAELVKANEDLTGYEAKARATAPVVETYRQQARLMDQKGIERQDLIRNIKAAEANYLLYVQKQEQARIADEMDQNRILNVAIAEDAGGAGHAGVLAGAAADGGRGVGADDRHGRRLPGRLPRSLVPDAGRGGAVSRRAPPGLLRQKRPSASLRPLGRRSGDQQFVIHCLRGDHWIDF